MRYAGVDFDTHGVDVVWLCHDEDEALHERVSIEPHATDAKDPWRAFRATREVRAAVGPLDWSGVGIAAIERPYSRGESRSKLMRIQGAIIASLPITVVEVWELAAIEWKAAFCGEGRAHALKDEVIERAIELGFRPPTGERHLAEDACDAFALAWVARELNRAGLAREAAA